MNARDLLLDLWQYRRDTAEQVIATLQAVDPEILAQPGTIPGGNGDGSIAWTMGHLVYVEEAWLQELRLGATLTTEPDFSRYSPFPALVQTWREVGAAWNDEIERTDLEKMFFEEEDGTRPVVNWAIIAHVMNHAAHHLSEVWTALTANGIQPPDIDLIDWASARLEARHG